MMKSSTGKNLILSLVYWCIKSGRDLDVVDFLERIGRSYKILRQVVPGFVVV